MPLWRRADTPWRSMKRQSRCTSSPLPLPVDRSIWGEHLVASSAQDRSMYGSVGWRRADEKREHLAMSRGGSAAIDTVIPESKSNRCPSGRRRSARSVRRGDE